MYVLEETHYFTYVCLSTVSHVEHEMTDCTIADSALKENL